jgi:SNF2 family DNA or RNA helicase
MVNISKYKKTDYIYKTDPYAHQEEVFILSRDKRHFALLLDMGTGKTKIAIDSCAWLYAKGKIDAVLVIAPNGVHSNWEGELKIHMPDWCNYIARIYNAKGNTKKYKDYMSALGKGAEGLKFLLMNVEAMATKTGQAYAEKLTRIYRTFTIVDESSKIKNPKAKRTKACIKVGRKSSYTRILTGTVVTQSPLDTYSQFDFLSPEILGFGSYFTFKARYAIIVKRQSSRGGKTWFYDDVIDYTNMDELTNKIKPHSYRIEKKDCLDLPDKVYTELRTYMEPDQKKVYMELKDKLIAELDDGEVITAPMALTKLLRLQQVTGGFVNDTFGGTHSVCKKNPKLETLMYDLDDVPPTTSVVIWARFRAEIQMIGETLKEVYGPNSYGLYYGGTSVEDRRQLIKDFQDKKVRFFVGNPQAGGMGITLTAASLVYYYSNDFSLENRMQSEDRCHRIGQVNKVLYKDIVIPGTVDLAVLKAHKDKKGLADLVQGGLRGYRALLEG